MISKMSTTVTVTDPGVHEQNDAGTSSRRISNGTISGNNIPFPANIGDDTLRTISPSEVQDNATSHIEAGSVHPPTSELSKGWTILVITTLTGMTLASSISTGLLTIGLPIMATDLELPENLLFW
jgi:hypothetical protein